MSIQYIDCPQGSDIWHYVRLGIPTASEFHTVMMKLKGGGVSRTRHRYMCRLAGERITGEPAAHYRSQPMWRGSQMEDEARAYYSLLTNVEVRPAGFILDDKLRVGCSPDGLVGDDGLIECKSNNPELVVDLIVNDEIPAEHYAQCQGQLWLTGRQWVDYIAYCPKLPRFAKRILPDPEFFARLAADVAEFNSELDAIVECVQRYGSPIPDTRIADDNLLAAG